jgi:hypothetical protein
VFVAKSSIFATNATHKHGAFLKDRPTIAKQNELSKNVFVILPDRARISGREYLNFASAGQRRPAKAGTPTMACLAAILD